MLFDSFKFVHRVELEVKVYEPSASVCPAVVFSVFHANKILIVTATEKATKREMIINIIIIFYVG